MAALLVTATLTFALGACGDDAVEPTTEPPVISQTIPRPATVTDSFEFQRNLRTDWTSVVDAVTFTVAGPDGQTLDAFSRIEIRVQGSGHNSGFVDACSTVFTDGAVS